MGELRDSLWAIIGRVLDLLSAFVDFVIASSVTVSALQLIGILLAAFALGLLLGRITKRGIQEAAEHPNEREADRVVLDFERLTPLGPSEEEEAENPAMDISDLRSHQMPDPSPVDNRKGERDPPSSNK